MRNLFKKPNTFIRIEFWAATTLFVFVLFFFITEQDGNRRDADSDFKPYFDRAGLVFNLYTNFFFPQLVRYISLYLAFVALNFIIVPKLLIREARLLNMLYIVLIFGALGLMFGMTDTYIRTYLYLGENRNVANALILREAIENTFSVFAMFAVYTVIKYAGMYMLAISTRIQARFQYIRKEAIVATVIWLAVILLLVSGEAEGEILNAWVIVVPCAILLYLASFHKLIPRALQHKKFHFFFYVRRCVVLLFATFFVVYFVFMLIHGDDDAAVGYSAFNSFFQLFITVPITWALYKRHAKGNEEITGLQKELKQSTANIDFLRSQINPHFLFNALNTLYGTAIQENADRTAEGIQKLGDMMRFMLQENIQEKISVVREIDYLENYISLQKLRTDASPTIQIQTQIQHTDNYYQVAPMLLIPFVENAFKHGISFREPSHIKVSLEIKEAVLYFDVYNSKHVKTENDPERDKSGIGLENVKQRLKLSYPDKHNLVIHDTTKEFFIHLTIQLTTFR